MGLVRALNEDSGYLAPYVALVADGVGGAAAGEIASATTAHLVAAHAAACFGADPMSVISSAVAASRAALRRAIASDGERAGMATTLTVLLTDGSRLVLGHLGDSRCYRYAESRLTRVSSDHTYVQQLVETGELDPAEVRGHPWRNVVIRALHADLDGSSDAPDLVELPARVGDRYLLCSDGLSDLVDELRIREVLALADPHSAAARLVEDALLAGGKDNVTCLVFDVIDGPRVVGDGQAIGALHDVRNLALPHAAPTT